MDYKDKYLKYKNKYNNLKKLLDQTGGKLRKNKYKNLNSKTSSSNYNIHVSEPWFSLIKLGLKSIEGRKNKGKFKEMKVDDVVEWNNNDFGERSFKSKILRKQEYKTFQEYLETEGLDKCLPGIDTLEEGVNVYYNYFTKEDEQNFGVIAIELEILN